MNTTSNEKPLVERACRSFLAADLSSGAVTAAGTAVQVPPLATVVLDLNQ